MTVLLNASKNMQEVLFAEGYVDDDMSEAIELNDYAERYGYLPSQLEKEDRDKLKRMKIVATELDRKYPERRQRI